MFLSILEIIYIIITVVVTGYVFSGIFKHHYVNHKENPNTIFDSYKIFNWKDVKLGIMIAAPGIVFHELAHKFTAMFLGLTAVYEIYPTGLLIGTVLRAMNLGFMFLAPGYVTITGATLNQSAITAFAGPFINLLLWIIPMLILKNLKNLKPKTVLILTATQKVNMWLFIFNMIPFPPLDGSKVIEPLLSYLF